MKMPNSQESNAKWDAQLRKGTLELAVLAALKSGPKYGLELLNYFQRYETMQITEGTLYPLLDRMKRDEVLSASWVQEGDSRPRKYYSLSSQGELRLSVLKSRWEHSVRDLKTILNTSFE